MAFFSSEFLVSVSGLLHSAGVLYVQVGGDVQLRWEATGHALNISLFV